MRKPRLGICITALGASEAELKALPKAVKSLEMYFEVSVWKDILASDAFESQPVKKRIQSLEWAFEINDIVMPWKGGFNSVELLAESDRIKTSKDKVFLGLSDNTLLANALPAMGLCRGWQGPSLWNWVKNPQFGGEWASTLYDLYSEDYEKMSERYNQSDISVYRPGEMRGKIWGGNNYSFDLLQGTNFWPDLTKPYNLFMEGEDILTDQKYVWRDFIRNIDAIMLQEGAKENLRGLMLGRFPETYELKRGDVNAFVRARAWLTDVPIVYNFPCGHMKRSLYLPLGEKVKIVAQTDNTIKMTKV